MISNIPYTLKRLIKDYMLMVHIHIQVKKINLLNKIKKTIYCYFFFSWIEFLFSACTFSFSLKYLKKKRDCKNNHSIDMFYIFFYHFIWILFLYTYIIGGKKNWNFYIIVGIIIKRCLFWEVTGHPKKTHVIMKRKNIQKFFRS